MSVKNSSCIKILLIALILLLSTCLTVTFSSTKVLAENNSTDPLQTWDISLDGDESLLASIYENSDQEDRYDLIITGTGHMQNFSGHAGIPWKDYMQKIISVSLPDGLLSIGEYALYGLINLPVVKIPSSVEEINSYGISYCYSLHTIEGGFGIKEIGFYAFTKSGVINFPFETMTSLSIIRNSAFSFTRISEVLLHDSVVTIGSRVFSNCLSLEKVTILGTNTKLASKNNSFDTFDGCSSNLKVFAHLSTNAYEAYPDLFQSLCEYDNCLDVYCNVCEAPGYGGAHEGEWQITLAPTTSSGGELKRACLLNPVHVETVILPALNSNDYVYNLIEEPTASEHGLASYTYEIDGFSFSFNVDVPLVREGLLDKATFNDAVFGIVLGAVVVVAVLTFGIFWFVLKRRH